MTTTRTTGIFKIPKDSFKVWIRAAGGLQLTGKLFLDFTLDEMRIHERISRFLESEHAFFPFIPEGGEKPSFFSRNTVEMLAAEMEEGWIEGGVSGVLAKINNVKVSMVDGTEIRGELLSDVPEHITRLSDRLNKLGRFIVVISAPWLYCLNTAYVVRIEENL